MSNFKWFFVLASLGLGSALQAASGMTLYDGGAEYLYAYPAGKASLKEQKSGNRTMLSYSLLGTEASGAGVGIKSANLKPYRASGALEFFISASTNKLNVGFATAGEKDKGFISALPLSHYLSVKKGGWSKVTIPLKDFPAQGSRWNAKKSAPDTMAFGWDRVAEFVVSTQDEPGGRVNFYITQIVIAPSYSAAAVGAAKKNAGKVSGALAVVSNGAPAEGVGAYVYPEGKSKQGASGSYLQVALDGSGWSGGGLSLGRSLDLSGMKASGKLVVKASGGNGGEVINLGLRNATNMAGVQVNINPYLPGGLKKGSVSTIVIPLSDLGDQGTKWDAEAGQNVTLPFDWSAVNEVIFDNNGPSQGALKIYFSTVQITP